MSEAVAEHDRILTRSIEESRGRLFKHLGDGVCAVFASAGDAVNAALTAQQAFLESEGILGLRIRAAVHTGNAELRDDDYFGPALNRVARLLETAHGTQTLLSGEAVDALGGGPPNGFNTRLLGTFRLRDLSSPIKVFQLDHPTLPDEYPPLRSLETFDHNLPIESDTFVGREEELETVGGLLDEYRIVTLTGAGGSGKTRLAIQAAAAALERFPHGVWLVELARLNDTTLLPDTVAASLRIPERPAMTALDRLTTHLRDKQLLMVLDNCEHMVEQAAAFAEHLVARCPDLAILTTSREGLRVPGETVLHLPPLATPSMDESIDVEGLARYDAVRLFADRARHHRPDFVLGADNAGSVRSICNRLDGLPLAIELAAARLRTFSTAQISDRLEDRFKLLTGGSRTSMPRHQTLEAAVAWSYELLEPNDRLLLARLSVFRGGFSAEAAERVCSDDRVPADDVVDHLIRLVESSLVEPQELPTGETRYRFLETIRQYSAARLIEFGEAAEARLRHARYFEEIARHADEALKGPEAAAWTERLDADRDNFRAALGWAIETEDAVLAVTLAAGFGRYWFGALAIHEGLTWVNRILGLPLPDGPETVLMLAMASFLAFHHGDFDEVERLAGLAEEFAERVGDPSLEAFVASRRAPVAAMRDTRLGVELYQKSLDHARATGDIHHVATGLGNIAFVQTWRGENEVAEAMATEHEAVLASIPEGAGAARAPMTSFIRGMARLWSGDLESATDLLAEARDGLADHDRLFTEYARLQGARALNGLERHSDAHAEAEEALHRVREAGAGVALAWALLVVAQSELGLGKLEEARHHATEGILVTTSNRIDVIGADLLEISAAIEAASGNDEMAIEHLAAGAALRERTGAVPPVGERESRENLVATLRDRVGAGRFDELWALAPPA